MSELKPCYCGGDKIFLYGIWGTMEGDSLDRFPISEEGVHANTLAYPPYAYCVIDEGCGIRGPESETVEGAITAWNNRPIEDALQAEIDRLKEFLDAIIDDHECNDTEGVWSLITAAKKYRLEATDE